MPKEFYTNIILPVPMQQLFTYRIPKQLEGKVQEGQRVTVQFGAKKIYTGLVFSIHDRKPSAYATKDILDVLDNIPIVNKIQLGFWKWISEYYMSTLGDVYRAGLPAGLKLESETRIYLNKAFSGEVKLNSNENLIIDILEELKEIPISKLQSVLPVKNVYPLVKTLLEKEVIFTDEILRTAYAPKTETMVYLNEQYRDEKRLHELFDQLGRAPVQLNALMAYISLSQYKPGKNPKPIPKKQLLEKSGSNPASFQNLVKKEVFVTVEQEVSRLSENIVTKAVSELNDFQEEAISKIRDLFKEKNIVLLHGVTSSGKTEIYIHLIREQLEKGKQVLYLLPEIALTAQIINRLKNVFGNRVGIYHSKFSDNERVEVYKRVLSPPGKDDDISIILGVRSSVYLPFNKLGLVIIDEEHENTYKQFDPAPRYHARDAAIYLASLHGAKTLLGTATPAIESYYNAKTGKYGLVEITQRYQDIELPEIVVVDIKRLRKKKEMNSLFSDVLIRNIDDALTKGEQVILFQNRRGYAPFLQCYTCGWIPYCKHCDVSLTYHKHLNKLVCHYCGYTINNPKTCEACGNPDLHTTGFGTEKIEEEINIFFPHAKTLRMDLDSTRSKKAYEKIISAFEDKKVDILIGTQMISKGLDFDNVSTVGIINADQMLNYPDFRAFERSFQLMAQVSGRAGRKNKRGKVIIQTSDPHHPIILDVLGNNYKSMFLKQLGERKEYHYPPFHKLILVKIRSKDINTANRAAEELAARLRKVFGERVMGPEFPVISRIQNWYQKNIILKIEVTKSYSKAKEILNDLVNGLLSQQAYKGIRVGVDVDVM